MTPNWFSSAPLVDPSRLSNEELTGTLRLLQSPAPEQPVTTGQLEALIRELNVHRCELELQNRTLREMQGELDATIRRYRDLYDHLPLAYLTLTPEGRIVEANLTACDWLQRERTLLVGQYLRVFLDAFNAGRFAAHLEEVGASAAGARIELALQRPDGSTVPVQLTSRVALARGNDRFIHTAISDLTVIKKAEQGLEIINREQDTFNASISHDLRAPLITILNYSGIIAAEHGALLDEEARTMLDRIGRAATRMERTLKLLLEYGAMAREEVVMEPLALDQMVRNVCTEQRELISETQAEVKNECPECQAMGSRSLLVAVLTNLLTNALKFVEPGKKPWVQISAAPEGDSVVLRVTDRGIGIDPKFHRQIFEVFQRLHGYSRYPGTGIGLAIARRGVERMRGKIWVESELGKGSCFCFSLRRA